MTVHFSKYQGTGNDFIILDNRDNKYILTQENVSYLCHRRFGIGADGLMLLETHQDFDFSMKYFNSDGREGSMCGNGGRCLVAFAHKLGIIGQHTRFIAVDGIHEASVTNEGKIRLKMSDVGKIQREKDYFFLNTGSPHYVQFVEDVKYFDVFNKGREKRHSKTFQPGGTNVNFVQLMPDNSLFVRTFERGVEDETLSCGTGVTASALSASLHSKHDNSSFFIRTLGGDLCVSFRKHTDGHFTDIFLEGPAQNVFEGVIDIN